MALVESFTELVAYVTTDLDGGYASQKLIFARRAWLKSQAKLKLSLCDKNVGEADPSNRRSTFENNKSRPFGRLSFLTKTS